MAYKVQIDDLVRDATPEETVAIEAQHQAIADSAAAQTASLEARKEPLRRLGLTDDEIDVVLGIN